MKKMILAAVTLLLPLTTFASIDLRPGSSIVVNGEVITCQAPEGSTAPTCSVKQDGQYYRVYTGTTIANTYYSFGDAVKGIKELKEAGLCR